MDEDVHLLVPVRPAARHRLHCGQCLIEQVAGSIGFAVLVQNEPGDNRVKQVYRPRRSPFVVAKILRHCLLEQRPGRACFSKKEEQLCEPGFLQHADVFVQQALRHYHGLIALAARIQQMHPQPANQVSPVCFKRVDTALGRFEITELDKHLAYGAAKCCRSRIQARSRTHPFQGFPVTTLRSKRHGHDRIKTGKLRIVFEACEYLRPGLFVAAREHQDLGENSSEHWRYRIEFDGTASLGFGLLVPASCREQAGVPLPGCRVVRGEFDRLAINGFGLFKELLVMPQHSQRSVRFAEQRIDGERFVDSRLPSLDCRLQWLAQVFDLQRARLGQPDPGQRVARVELHGLFEMRQRAQHCLTRSLHQFPTAESVLGVSLQARGRRPAELLRIRVSHHAVQGRHDFVSYLALDCEQVLDSQLAVIGFRPEMFVIDSVDQLHIDAYPVAGPLHAAFENRRHAELYADIRDGQLGIAIAFCGRPRNDLVQRRQFCELRQNIVVNAGHHDRRR